MACFRLAVSMKPPLLLLDFAVLVLSFVLSLKLLNCGPDLLCWLVADACVGARIVPAISNAAIAAAIITIPIDCFLSFILSSVPATIFL